MPALKLALKDDNNSVRIQAATAMATIENQFSERIMTLKPMLDKDSGNPRLNLAMAHLYDDHAFSGMLDNSHERESRQMALLHYQRYLETSSDDSEAILAVGRLHARNRDYAKAVEWFDRQISRGKITPPMILWLLECHFRLGNFKAVKENALRFKPMLLELDTLPGIVQDTVRAWAGEVLEIDQTKEIAA
jgi:tetratricopeptide (TPR) repeat protein